MIRSTLLLGRSLGRSKQILSLGNPTTRQQYEYFNSQRIHHRTFAGSSTNESNEELSSTLAKEETQLKVTSLVNGPNVQFGMGRIANLAESSVVGSSGQTVAMATMASSIQNEPSSNSFVDYLRKQSSFLPLTVDYRQRHHAVGKIPPSGNRSDNRRPTDTETLASRAIDRALRPLMKKSEDAIHLSCSIQACPLNDKGGHPVALALNSASVALRNRLEQLVGCVYLNLLKDGTILVDQAIPHPDSVCELLYAGTREKVVMMEFSGMLSENHLVDLITLAHGCVQPMLDAQEKLPSVDKQDMVDDLALRAELSLSSDATALSGNSVQEQSTDDTENQKLFDEAFEFCKKKIGESSLRLFGVGDIQKFGTQSDLAPRIHPISDPPLVSKKLRGRKEHMLRNEIKKLLPELKSDSARKDEYKTILEDASTLATMGDLIHSKLLKEAMALAAIMHGRRADGRGDYSNGCTTIRPLSMEVPALPDCVHGSSLFTRGETQVLCTATLGPPRDGILLNDPYIPVSNSSEKQGELPFQDLPVGSLRYLKTQEFLESDLNTRRVRADRQQTGDSGIMKERRRAFLQYDFPAYSKGEVQQGPAGGNRREIGHGALAEKAILPVLPTADAFPYAIRMTSEVTSSNGSSSMATICGATLALLDAGVPIVAPVAGVSLGLAEDPTNGDHRLLLDITGNEDYFGSMDFKIAGTESAVTAFQLDVAYPLPLSLISEALYLAKDARGAILREMEVQSRASSSGIISGLLPRSDLKDSAPRVNIVRYDPARKKSLVGPGGAVIRQMEDRFNVSLDLTQDGQCLLFGDDHEMVRKATAAVMDLVADVEVGGVYEGTVIELRDFGAIIELLRNKEGLCHVSEMADKEDLKANTKGTLGLVHSLLKVGQKIEVVCLAVDPVQGTIKLKPHKKSTSLN
jgi:polyribonucleotide nucleotidyltransferase